MTSWMLQDAKLRQKWKLQLPATSREGVGVGRYPLYRSNLSSALARQALYCQATAEHILRVALIISQIRHAHGTSFVFCGSFELCSLTPYLRIFTAFPSVK